MKEKWPFRNLVFEGCGIKSIAYAGVVDVLDKEGILKNIQRVGGTSGGAIISALLSVGYDAKEIAHIVPNTEFHMFKDGSRFGFMNLKRFVKEYGLYKGDVFEKWLEDKIKHKVGKNITFKQLYNLQNKNSKKYKLLYVTGTEIATRKSMVFSHETTPGMKISEAVRISMSLPLVFRAVKYRDRAYADGMIYYNYPLDLFDKDRYSSNKKLLRKYKHGNHVRSHYNGETLGFRVDDYDEIQRITKNPSYKRGKIKSIKDYLFALINGWYESSNHSHLHKEDEDRTVFIHNPGITMTNFKLNSEQKNNLVRNGSKATRQFLRKRLK